MSTLNKYIWIVDKLNQAGEHGISLKEINKMWIRNEDISCGEPIPRQTFDRWKRNILDLLGVIIECHTKGGYRYYIENPEILSDDKMNRWLLDTYTTINTLSKHTALHNRILAEEIPSNRNFLTFFINAMKDNNVVVLTYKNFTKEKENSFPICPYCLKMFHKRWYVLALSTNENKLRIYSLDRIVKVELTGQHFTIPKDFDAKAYFSSYFGIVIDETVNKQRIILRAYKPHQNYLRALPLHHSQKEIYTCDNYADFELSLKPTYDFTMELLRSGALIEVLEPESLRQEMYRWVKDLWNMYKSK